MKKIMFLFAAAVVLAAVGCSKDDAALNNAQYVSELKINFEGGTRVNASHSAAGLKFAWEDGDVIRVRPISNINAVYEFAYNSESSSFVATSANGYLKVGDEYIAEAGKAGTFAVIGDNKAKGVLVAAATEEFGQNLPMVSDKFTAESKNTIATMHHIAGVVEIPVKTAEGTLSLTDIQLCNPYGSYYDGWAGTYNVDLSTLVATLADGQGETYKKLSIEGGKEISTTTTSIFIPVLPMQDVNVLLQYKLAGKAYSNNVYFDDNTLTVERGKITKISEVTLVDYQ